MDVTKKYERIKTSNNVPLREFHIYLPRNHWRLCVGLVLIITLCVFIGLFTYKFGSGFICKPLSIILEISPSSFANDAAPDATEEKPFLVCYYVSPHSTTRTSELRLRDVNAMLCTHINIGLVGIINSSLVIPTNVQNVLKQDVPVLRLQNPDLKLLLWIGGGERSDEFSNMVVNHAQRKVFLQSLKEVLRQYSLDGVDLDWEFPSAHNKERQHFSQLLYEIKQEYRRERRDYLLSLAVAAPEGIALFAYDVREINMYADIVNVMSYDYHFYSRSTPFTGLNAPLYARESERSILSTFNINYSVNWWLNNGLDRKKLVVGLPTYGHSFTLVNPYNSHIGAPASGIGECGRLGFTTYSDLCRFKWNSIGPSTFFDQQTCSPYLASGTEWISYENETSIECKVRFIKSNNLGGAMIFSLNTDDFDGSCSSISSLHVSRFPLVETVKNILYQAQEVSAKIV